MNNRKMTGKWGCCVYPSEVCVDLWMIAWPPINNLTARFVNRSSFE